jgi:hypothetical protein
VLETAESPEPAEAEEEVAGAAVAAVATAADQSEAVAMKFDRTYKPFTLATGEAFNPAARYIWKTWGVKPAFQAFLAASR